MRRSACILSAALLSAAGFMLVSGDAHAQGTPPAAPPADGVAPAAPPPTGAPPAAHDDDEHEDGRLRIGFNINGGIGTTTNLSGPTFGGTFRVGYQINRLMGAYANISPFVWAASYSGPTVGGFTVDASAAAGVQTAPMFSLTPIDLLEIAAGPSIDYLGSASTSTAANTASAGGSVNLGIHGRVALHLGSRNPDTGRRKGFTIGGDIHPTFTSGSATTFFTLGLGADWY